MSLREKAAKNGSLLQLERNVRNTDGQVRQVPADSREGLPKRC
jgi:hypothetical protein